MCDVKYKSHCTHAKWRIIDDQDNKDYQCSIYGYPCYRNEYCSKYEPEEGERDEP